ncbi:MAG TPA: UDP-N-acetylglucosamine 2-epimerase (non-hydrolyzing), partial [Terriglobales bacterium]|nr:UDP-N-acetylglucosamine 2-epimerase (non-hydrolyzing) [Terriglobales bacterium]
VFGLHAQRNLHLMERAQTLSHLSARLLEQLTALFRQERPDLILVQGDTTSVFAASLAAFYEGIAVGHVEAGLRTQDKRNPFPEELNRRVTSLVADLHFAPTQQARENLLREQVDSRRIYVTGNTVIDALQAIRGPARERALREFPFLANGHRTILVTAHRRENHGAPLERICRAVALLVQEHPEIRVIWPVHPNPQVCRPVYDLLHGRERVHLLPALSYTSFIGVLDLCALVLTDSGGVQEEAPALGRPTLVLRDTTERPEGVMSGTVKLVGTEVETIIGETSHLLSDEYAYRQMSLAACPYGDGRAAERIVAAIRNHWGLDRAQPEAFCATSATLAMA